MAIAAANNIKLPRKSIAKTASERQSPQQRVPKHQDNK
jgi:hypothetical protein